MKFKKWVALAGGLGNQLFQYAHSISNLSEGQQSRLECIGFKVGNANPLNPELLRFNISRSEIGTQDWKISKLEQRCFNYLLRNSTYKTPYKLLDPIKTIARVILFPRTCFNFFAINEFTGNLFVPKLEIGYFQNRLPTKDVIGVMQEISLLQASSKVSTYVELAKIEKPLAVHLRIGDYKLDSNFGCLSSSYYHAVIQEFFIIGNYGKIWLFSDETEEAVQKLPKEFLGNVRIIDPELTPAETFEVLRLGAGFIIANSSFSYWAAMLRKNPTSVVIAPSPWFKKSSKSASNFPEDWVIREAQFD